MLKKVRLTLTALFMSGLAFAQSGSIVIHMTDKATKEAIPFANVVVEQKGTQISGGATDIDGKVTIKPLEPGEYDVKAVYEGYQEQVITGITVSADKPRYLEIAMVSTAQQLGPVIIKYHPPLIDPQTKSGGTIDREQYEHMAVKDINSVAANQAGVYQSDVGGALYIRGARSDATQYIVDGQKVTGTNLLGDAVVGGLPQSMIDQVSTYVGGIPAKYGDATGGVVEINTISASPKFFGSVQGITSEVLDKFGYNDVNFSFGGPLISRRDRKDTVNHTKIPVLNFVIGGEYSHQTDGSPSFIGGYSVNGDVLSQIQKTPFVINPAGGFLRSAEFVTADQITHTATRPNIPAQALSLNGKLDWHVNNYVTVTAGGSYENDQSRYFEYVYELFNSAENPLHLTTSYRGFVRFTQRFPTPEGKDQNPLIKNAYYNIQAEYGSTYDVLENNDFKENYFDYGYIGKFYQYQVPVYQTKSGSQGVANYMVAYRDSLLTFTPGTQNPLEANYTSEIYQLLGPQNITNPLVVEQNQGLMNGDRPDNVYSLWYNTGRAYPAYTKQQNDHFRFQANFSADIKSNAIQLGFEYEQNIISHWELVAANLWTVMRNNSNTQLQQLDTTNPILVGMGEYNTYNYNRYYNASQQSQFDKSLRQKLGLAVNSTTWIQPDYQDPGIYSLNMFSASDLLNGGGGNSLIGYYGYSYLGDKSNSNPSIDDFFNHRDANGNLDYPIAAYHPIYMAGYIQDHFDIKSMKFDVGVRVDRFDANQPVLKDPYLLYPAKTVAEVEGSGLGEIPSNMGSNYVVYVNNSSSPTAIVGYRNGNTWYNASGNAVTDPTILATATTNGSIQPYLENPNQTTVSSNVFTTYTPQVNVMPRIAFAFPISDVANFFAHYDVLTMRPPGIGYNLFAPLSYLYIQNNIGAVLSNPDLLPQQTTEYELGFTQILNEKKTAALQLSAFYRENRNNLQVYRFLEAYPVSYMAYSNIDFGTTKGLSIAYNLTRVNNFEFRASYTLQFATGTGSGPNSGVNLASSGEPNLQIPQPLDNDQRHTFLFNLDYHYSTGSEYNGPVWTTKAGKAIQILANAGINLNITAGSGTPYTQQGNATEGNPVDQNVAIGIAQHYTLVGSINGAYKPWQYRVDARIDKEFPIIINPSKGDKALHCGLVVYFQIFNLLNTENLINVYHFTGSATDDGFLSSTIGQQTIATSTNAGAFQDQYKIKELDPSYFSLPRQIRFGVDFNF